MGLAGRYARLVRAFCEDGVLDVSASGEEEVIYVDIRPHTFKVPNKSFARILLDAVPYLFCECI